MKERNEWLGARGKMKRKVATVVCLWITAMLLVPSAGQASLKHLLIGPFGSVANPTFGAPTALAVDPSSDDLLVADSQTQTIERFHSDGTPAPFSALGSNSIDASGNGECPSVPGDCDETPQNGFTFTGLGGAIFPGEFQLAVDASGTVTDGNIYVTQSTNNTHLVDIFAKTGEYLGQLTEVGKSPCGVAVDSNGAVYVADVGDGKIFKFVPSGNPPTNADLSTSFTTVSLPCNLAAGSGPTEGALFANRFFTQEKNSVLKVNAANGELLGVIDPLVDMLVAVDASTGRVIVAGEDEELREFDASGDPGELFATASTKFKTVKGMAIHDEHVYISSIVSGAPGQVLEYGPPVVIPDVVTGAVTIIDNTSASLEGTVRPGGVALTDCHFEYGTTTAYGSTAPCAESLGSIGTGADPVSVHADVSGLAGETAYHYRLVVTNENGEAVGNDEHFRTPSKPELVRQQVGGVTSSEATLAVGVIPGNSPTSVIIEWGETAAYGNVTPPITVDRDGKGLTDDTLHTLETTLTELAEATRYHWRAVATNALGTVTGQDRTFRTYPTGVEQLPDRRAYELVSPAIKGSADFAMPFAPGGVADSSVKPIQAAPDGNAITFTSFASLGADAAGAAATSQYLSRRDPNSGAWSTKNLNVRFEEGSLRDPFVGFSRDLSSAALLVLEPALTEDASATLPNLYKGDTGSGSLSALTTEPPVPVLAVPEDQYCLSYGGASADFGRIVFAARGALLPGNPAGQGFNLYAWTKDKGLELVSRLPGASGTPATPRVGTGFGSLSGNSFCLPMRTLLRHAISEDGKRIFWTYEGTFQGAINPLLARVENPDGTSETVRLDAAAGGVAPGGNGEFWDASADGSKVYFTSPNKLTAGSKAAPQKPDLYRYDFDAEAGSRLSDLSDQGAEAAEVKGVIGASRDGAYVYFTAKGVLTATPNSQGLAAEAGRENLYVWHDGDITFIGIASSASATPVPTEQAGRLTPDGRHLVFTSPADLTGAGTEVLDGSACDLVRLGLAELVPGPACEEVFLFDAEGNELRCVSCSPAGANPIGPSRVPPWSTPYEQPRYLSDDGSRVMFDTLDSLTPADSNGKRDVYQFETAGTGTCSVTSVSYSDKSEGCITLLSSGTSSAETYLLDASSDGDDVFISTRERLNTADVDEQYDVYDVRVDGVLPPIPPPDCGASCRSAPSAPVPSIPPSESLPSGGNAPGGHKCPRGTRKVVKHGKTKCIKKKGGSGKARGKHGKGGQR